MTIFQAIVLDLDGTLLNDEGKISNKTKEFLLNENKKGTAIILATGRSINMTVEFHKELDLKTPLICLNGAVIYDRHKEQVLSYFSLHQQEVEFIKKLVFDHSKLLLMHTSHSNYQIKNDTGIKIEDYHPIERIGLVPPDAEPILKVSAYMSDRTTAMQALNQLIPHFEIADWNDCLEVTKKSVTKWKTLQFVLNKLQINPKDAVAFGDGPNDYEMIKNVGVGVAMRNAIPALKEVSDFVTMSHTEDGITYFIENSTKIISSF